MAEETENVETTTTGGGGMNLVRVEHFVEQNKQAVLIGGGVVAVVVIALIYVFFKYLPDQNQSAQKEMYMAEFAFAKDSFAVALNGNGTYKGFAEVANKYSWTKAGNLANYYAGICCLNLKKYDDAVKHLDKFSTSDAVLGALKLNATGDAYAEQNKMDDAVRYYQKAADFSDNEGYTPMFLLKAGMAYESQKKYDDAKKCYEKVRDKYPNTDEGRDIEKYIARASAAK